VVLLPTTAVGQTRLRVPRLHDRSSTESGSRSTILHVAKYQTRPNAPQQKKHRYSMTSSAISEQRRRHSKAPRPGAPRGRDEFRADEGPTSRGR
jgi:hypothetical protein